MYEDECFGKHPVLTCINPEDTTKEDRFLVVALKDIGEFCWWSDAYTMWATKPISTSLTSSEFGQGKTNTDNIMALWRKEPPEYEHDTGKSPDIWGKIETQYDNGWFVPSYGDFKTLERSYSITSKTPHNELRF